jgi:hypothetical protein
LNIDRSVLGLMVWLLNGRGQSRPSVSRFIDQHSYVMINIIEG